MTWYLQAYKPAFIIFIRLLSSFNMNFFTSVILCTSAFNLLVFSEAIVLRLCSACDCVGFHCTKHLPLLLFWYFLWLLSHVWKSLLFHDFVVVVECLIVYVVMACWVFGFCTNCLICTYSALKLFACTCIHMSHMRQVSQPAPKCLKCQQYQQCLVLMKVACSVVKCFILAS